MGKENNAMLEYLEDEERFADVFNGGCFGGRQIVNAEELTEGSEVYVENAGETPQGGQKRNRRKQQETTTRTRDIKKRLQSGNCLRILAIENQNEVDFSMPWRHMNYDALEYGRQVKKRRRKNRNGKLLQTPAEKVCGLRKSDRLVPTYTVCVYHGTEKWDGPRSLRDMMDFGDDAEEWERLFCDYRMHLICVNEIRDFSKFRSPLREFLQLLSCREDDARLQVLLTENEQFKSIDEETARAASVLMGNEVLIENAKNEEEGTYNMCKALQKIMEDSENVGYSKGRNVGHSEGFDISGTLFLKLNKDNRMEDWMIAIRDKEYRAKLLDEYGLIEHKLTC